MNRKAPFFSRRHPLTIALVLAYTASAIAQTAQRSSVTGIVTDAAGTPLAGARVVLNGDAALGGPRTVETGSDGTYRLSGLLTGSYRITVSADGFQTAVHPDIALPVETTWTIDFRLELSRLAEQVKVSAVMPLVDVTTSASPSNFAETVLQNIPTGRTLVSVLNLAPGVTENVSFGGTQGSNGLTLDRVTLTEPLLGNAWIPVSSNWLNSVQVVSLGAPAEYGQFTGAIASGILRSGGNRFSGVVEALAAVPEWTGDNTKSLDAPLREQFTPRDLLSWWDINGQFGGPLVRDRLWFFAAAGSVRERYRPFGYSGPESSERHEPRGVAKVDAAPSVSLLVHGFYQRDVGNTVGEQLSVIAPTVETAGQLRRRNHVWNARTTWNWQPGTLIEAWFGGFSGYTSFGPVDPARAAGPPPRTDWFLLRVSDNVLNLTREDRRTMTAGVRLGHVGRLLGSMHDVAVGVEVEGTRATTFHGLPGGRVDEFWDGVPQGTMFWDGDDVRTRGRRTSLYVQDRWRVHRRLTLEPGIRVEAYGGLPRESEEVFRTRPVALRMGGAWDVTDTHRTVLRAHYGRYHDMLFAQIYAGHDREGLTPRIWTVEVAPGEFREVRREFDGIPAFPIDPELKQSHVDQWSGGLEHQLAAHVALEARYVVRRFENFIGYVDRRLDEWVSFTSPDPGPDGRPATGDESGNLVGYVPYWYAGGDRDLVIANPEGAYRSYRALQFIARKRQADNWEGQASYTWSRSSGPIPGSQHTNATLSNLSPLGFGGSPGGIASLRDMRPGRSLFDYTELKLLGWYRSSHLGGALVGVVYRWHTGSRWHRWAAVFDPATNYTDFAVAEVPFSRVTPSIALLDLRLEKTFPARRVGKWGLYVDALNVTNTGKARGYVARSGPRFGQPLAWTEPRTLRIGVRYSF